VNTSEALCHAGIVDMNSCVCVCVCVCVLNISFFRSDLYNAVGNLDATFKEITLVQSPAFCNIKCVANHGGHGVYFDSVFPITD